MSRFLSKHRGQSRLLVDLVLLSSKLWGLPKWFAGRLLGAAATSLPGLFGFFPFVAKGQLATLLP